MRRAVHLAACISVISTVLPPVALAFPPYRSTDADTAPLGVVEARLGLVRLRHEHDDDRYAAPLLRLNLGIASAAEITLESEYDLDESRLGDGALGLKLVSRGETLNWGVETLSLLPVNSSQSGVGVESQLLATWKPASLRVHFNAGAFYDPRGDELERGWRASVLTEYESSMGRPGLELFARRFHHERTEVQLGAGWIVPIGSIELRIGIHSGLAGNVPDLTATLWVSTQKQLW